MCVLVLEAGRFPSGLKSGASTYPAVKQLPVDDGCMIAEQLDRADSRRELPELGTCLLGVCTYM